MSDARSSGKERRLARKRKSVSREDARGFAPDNISENEEAHTTDGFGISRSEQRGTNRTEMKPAKDVTATRCEELLSVLKARFEKNMNRHKNLEWSKLQTKLEANSKTLSSLSEMERTGGEPDVVDYDKTTGEYLFYDCSMESPKGRRSLCYDREALESRKEHKPKNNTIDMAAA